MTLPDGSIILSPEDLAVFGDGDPRRGARELRVMIANEKDRAVTQGRCQRSESASVRVATQADAQAIFELLLLDVAENAEIVAPADEDSIRETIAQALSKPNIAGVIDGPGGKPIAVIILIAIKWWWSRAYYYQEIPLFVHPDHRKSDYGRRLVNFQKWWVDEMTRGFGYRVHLLCGVLGVRRVPWKIMMYRRHFGRPVGAAWLYPYPMGG